MSREATTFPPSYFEAKYQSDIDPWKFRTSDYEREKYAATLSALTKPSYHSGLEVGCAIGVLTALLARRCEQLLAVDGSKIAVEEAKRELLPNVQFEVRCFPCDLPEAAYDLIMLSEVLYYFTKQDLEKVADDCAKALKMGGEIIMCHWLGETNYPLTGHQASDMFAAALRPVLPVRTILRDETYRLERLTAD